MPNCQNVGESGYNISLGSYGAAGPAIPLGVLCNLIGYSKSANGQFAQVMNTDGTIVAKIYSAGSPGDSIQPMMPPQGFNSSFVADGRPYTISVGNTGSQNSQVIASQNTIPPGGPPSPNATYWIFISEDTPNGGDCDFNDSTVLLFWNLNAAG